MISLGSARALASTGLVWEPARGDRFVIADRDMDDEVFVLSDMTIETHDYRTGRVLGFNGTTEWALDSVDAQDVLWLPGEGALRALLGPAFVRLESDGLAGWSVTASTADGGEATVTDPDAEEAYALALLSVRATGSAALLPLAAHPVVAAAAALDAGGPGAWSEDASATVEELVAHLRTHRARLGGAEPGAARSQAVLVEDADPVAEDRAGTLRRAVSAVLHHQGTTGAPGAARTPAGAGADDEASDALLVHLVLAARALGSHDLSLVCVRRAVDAERARTARAGGGPRPDGARDGARDGAGEGGGEGEPGGGRRDEDGAVPSRARAVQSLGAALAELDDLLGG